MMASEAPMHKHSCQNCGCLLYRFQCIFTCYGLDCTQDKTLDRVQAASSSWAR